ncbi:MAG: hypothetical protein IPF92_00440 [Myxococcales bacterium]|jgi:hypothetical protein|nr:hypothetical protein [Myxococcales bacterium]MBL0193600.1 hypothetical protein [Myxococcales bacterium]
MTEPPDRRLGPGLAKSRASLLLHAPAPGRVRTCDAAWRELFDRADVVSEGGVRDEPGGEVWYGTTSALLRVDASLAAPFEPSALAERDLHARLRAVRLARREALSRAPSTLGPLRCELRFSTHPRGLRVDVEVEAALIEAPARRGAGGPR